MRNLLNHTRKFEVNLSRVDNARYNIDQEINIYSGEDDSVLKVEDCLDDDIISISSVKFYHRRSTVATSKMSTRQTVSTTR